MNQQLKIEFRKTQLFFNQDEDSPIIVTCVDGIPTYEPGTLSPNDYIDVTEDTEGLDKLKLSWSASTTGTDTTQPVAGANDLGSNFQKGISVELTFKGAAFQFIFDWLMTDPCQLVNSVQVKITDVECGKEYRLFEIKVDNIVFAPYDNPCIVSVPLRERDDVIHVFNKTIVEDDWQGWFNSQGTAVKEHPTFMFVQEKRPKFMLVSMAAIMYIAGMLSTGVMIALTAGKDWIHKVLGITYFCPAPLIRDYIQNICDKYGFTHNTIFDDIPENDYRNLCLFFPVTTDYNNYDGFTSPSNLFIWDNRTGYPFSFFLDKLKVVFNAEWYCTPNNELIFQHKSYFEQLTPLIDFTAPGAIPIYGFEYTFNGNKKPAYGEYHYKPDPNDLCNSDLKWRYDDIVDFDGPANNTMLEGNVQKQFDFAATSFMYDGSFGDFIKESVEVARLIAIGAVFIGLVEILVATNFITAAISAALVSLGYIITNGYVNNFFNSPDLKGAVRVSNNNINVPRLLLWDGESMNAAKVYARPDAPDINPYYNIDTVDYYTEHKTYEGDQNFGTDVTDIYNYPMYLDANYKENLYDRFHEVDNSLKNPVINQTWTGTIDLCCSNLDLLGVWDGDFIKIGAVVILEKRGDRLIKGRITNIDPDYSIGQIVLKGNVLK